MNGETTEFQFRSIHIIQSLPSGELRAGIVLQTALLWAFPDLRARILLHEVEDRSTLVSVLAAVHGELERTGILPLLHIESHGVSDGIVLASGEVLEWHDLCRLLIPINVASRLNLFVSLACCFGENLARAIRLTEPAPFIALVGPNSTQQAGLLSDAFASFYTELLAKRDLDAALVAAGGGTPDIRKPLVLWPADYFFAQVFTAHLRERGSKEEIERSASKLAARLLKQKSLPSQMRRNLARDLRRELGSHEKHFYQLLRTYLILDRYPENEERFGLKWSTFAHLVDRSQ